MTWTANTLANRFAHVHGLNKNQTVRAHRIFRNLVVKSVVPSTIDPNDGRGTWRFDDDAAHVAVLCFPLAMMAVDVRSLRLIACALLEEKEGPKRLIETIREDVQAKREVFLRFDLDWPEGLGSEKSDEFRLTISQRCEGEAEILELRPTKPPAKFMAPPLARIEVAAKVVLGPIFPYWHGPNWY